MTAVALERSAPTAEQNVQTKPRLDALTSLRFFAAFSIVLMHFKSMVMPACLPWLQGLSLHQGVSFFYVLSGFILAYVYPEVPDLKAIFKFLRARFARVYPTHLLTLFISAAIVRHGLPRIDFKQYMVANLFLIQDWIPITNFYWSFNAPAWSISCEFFFYLMFPFLIFQWVKTGKTKLFVCAAVTVAMIALTCLLRLPVSPPGDTFQATSDWFTTLAPPTRILEFAIGIATAYFYRKRGHFFQLSGLKGTIVEVLVLIAAIAFLDIVAIFPFMTRSLPFIPIKFYDWFSAAGGAPIYAAAIFVFAKQKGRLSGALTLPIFVLLGEISFAMYLIHYPVIQYFSVHKEELAAYPAPVLAAAFWTIVFVGSYLSFTLVEKPCRNLLTGQTKIFRLAGFRALF